MNCPSCDRYVLSKHCPGDPASCPWLYCQTCKLDFDDRGRTKQHKVLPGGGV